MGSSGRAAIALNHRAVIPEPQGPLLMPVYTISTYSLYVYGLCVYMSECVGASMYVCMHGPENNIGSSGIIHFSKHVYCVCAHICACAPAYTHMSHTCRHTYMGAQVLHTLAQTKGMTTPQVNYDCGYFPVTSVLLWKAVMFLSVMRMSCRTSVNAVCIRSVPQCFLRDTGTSEVMT